MRIKYILYAMLGIGVTIILGGLFLLQKELKRGEASLRTQNVSLSIPKPDEAKPMYRITRDARIVPIDTGMDTHIVLLTIDDGPSVHTNTIKDILKKVDCFECKAISMFDMIPVRIININCSSF